MAQVVALRDLDGRETYGVALSSADDDELALAVGHSHGCLYLDGSLLRHRRQQVSGIPVHAVGLLETLEGLTRDKAEQIADQISL